MSRKHLVLSAASAAVGVALLSACSGTGGGYGGAAAAGASNVARVQQATTAVSKLAAAQVEGLGEVVTDQAGLTLYRFDRDLAKPPTSNCNGDCATTWPPVLADPNLQLQGIDKAMVGKVKRADGSEQVTLGGWPVYRYAKDAQAGEAKGQGVGGAWFAVSPQGAKAVKAEAPPAATTKLLAGNVDGIGPAITDQNGMTLYLFTKDTKKPSKSNCDGDCATNWPPVLDDGNVELQGIDQKLLGTVKRGDGTQQVTVGGWPVYRFAKDTQPGEAKGHGAMGTWFVIEPAGCKSATPPATSSTQTSTAPSGY